MAAGAKGDRALEELRGPIIAPWAWAASSMRTSPLRSAIFAKAGTSAAWPYRCTGKMALVRGVIAASTRAGARL